MPDLKSQPEKDRPIDSGDEFRQRADDPITLTVPPAVIGFLLLLAVLLACVFYIAAQVVHTA